MVLHEGGWLPQLAVMGWSVADVFGCHRHAPLARLDCGGLLQSIDGRRLISLTVDSAKLKTASGVMQTYRPRLPAGTRSIWEMQACHRGSDE